MKQESAKARVKRLRRGHRVVNLAAWNRSGAGAHTNKRAKRANNASKNWRNEEW